MALMARVSLAGPQRDEPEDFLESALSIIFPDDATNQHGDRDQDLLYTAPSLPKPLRLVLNPAEGESDRSLFSHYLWNSSLLLAELVEGGSWRPSAAEAAGAAPDAITSRFCRVGDFDVAGQAVLELGAGTALPSILAAHLGAAQVTVTDYPSYVVLTNLQANMDRNVGGLLADADAAADAAAAAADEEDRVGPAPRLADVVVTGHSWGELDTPLARDGRHAYDRVFVCDCLDALAARQPAAVDIVVPQRRAVIVDVHVHVDVVVSGLLGRGRVSHWPGQGGRLFRRAGPGCRRPRGGAHLGTGLQRRRAAVDGGSGHRG